MKIRDICIKASVLLLSFTLTLALVGCNAVTLAPQDKGQIAQYGDGYRFDKNGWAYVHIEGEPKERGFQHGYLLAPEIEEIMRSLKYLTYWDTGMDWEFFVEAAEKLFTHTTDQEFLEEIKGIAEGARANGADVSWQEILAWNGYVELTGSWWPLVKADTYATIEPIDKDGCSAFIAVGSFTKGGEIVMAHNSWAGFELAQFLNLILDIEPANGHRIFMQSFPGCIHSYSDFFITGAGIMGTETTISGFNQYDPEKTPEFSRIREAMQYADNLDSFVEIMTNNNNGGYANSWLLADVNTLEIMRLELGLKSYNVERKKDGYFIGFNAPVDPRIRNLECDSTGYADIRTQQGARQVRLTQLMEKYSGKIDVKVAQKILSDHYDVYLNKNTPSSRTVEGHYELDAMEYCQSRPPFSPKGTVDGKVTDSELAKNLSLWARWGSSSGISFNAKKYLDEHIQYSHLEGYLKDRPTQPWTYFTAGEK